MEQVIVDCSTGDEAIEPVPAEVEAEMTERQQAAVVEQQTADQHDANRRTLEQRTEVALVDLRAYVDRTSPTQAQTVAVVKLLCRVCIALIRLQLRRLDATD